MATWHHGCQRQSWLVFRGIPHTYIERCGNEQGLKPGVTLDAQGMVSGTSYHQQGLKILMAVKPPFLSSDTEFLNHFSNPSVSKKLPESFGNGHGSLCKKIDCCCDSLFRYSRAQGYPMIPEHRWIHGSMGLADGSSRGCRDVSSTFSKKAVRRGWKTYSQSVD